MRITSATARPRTTGTIRALIIDTSCLPNETRKAAVPLPDEPRTLRRAMRAVSGNRKTVLMSRGDDRGALAHPVGSPRDARHRRAARRRQSGADGDGDHKHDY